jgi:hypothetical protein
MSWLYSQVLVAEYSEANSLAGAPSALSSASPTPQAYSSPDRMTAFSRLSRFGMTFKPLTEIHGEAVLTWFLAGFPAKTSAQPEKEQALTELEADCGKKWRGLLVKWDQDMFSSKTVLCSEQEDSTLFSKTLPKWGMMLDGECWEQSMPVRLTKETESGLWGATKSRNGEMRSRKLLDDAEIRTKHNLVLSHKWPTPRARKMRKLWPTPGANEDSYRLGGNSQQSKSLGSIARREALAESPESGGQLNPPWVEWLMGWPLGWTDLKPLETDKSQRWPHSHGMS